MDLITKYRPQNIDEVYGNAQVKKIVKSWGEKIPHCIMLEGQSGCGKTTVAEIIANIIPESEVVNLNGVEKSTKDDMVSLLNNLPLRPLGKKNRVIIINECQKLGRYAQEVLLMPLENLQDHNYFIFTTTDPQDMKLALKNRCVKLNVKSLELDELADLVDEVYQKETGKECGFSDKFMYKLHQTCQGSPRDALTHLAMYLNMDEKDIEIANIEANNNRQAVDNFVKLLLNGNFAEVAGALKLIKESEIEGIRQGCLRYSSAVFLNKGIEGVVHKNSLKILENFKDNFFYSGKPGFVLACYKIKTRQQ